MVVYEDYCCQLVQIMQVVLVEVDYVNPMKDGSIMALLVRSGGEHCIGID